MMRANALGLDYLSVSMPAIGQLPQVQERSQKPVQPYPQWRKDFSEGSILSEIGDILGISVVNYDPIT